MALSREQVEVLNLFEGKFKTTPAMSMSLTARTMRELRKMRLVVLVDQTYAFDVWMITRMGKAARGMNQNWRGLENG